MKKKLQEVSAARPAAAASMPMLSPATAGSIVFVLLGLERLAQPAVMLTAGVLRGLTALRVAFTGRSPRAGGPRPRITGMRLYGNAQSGGSTVFVVGMLGGALVVASVVVNAGQLFVTHAELQNVADVSAKSATRELARVYLDSGRVGDSLSSGDMARIATVANERAVKNSAGGTAISVAPADVEIGKWSDSTGRLDVTSVDVNAVQVRARRDATSNGVVSALFSGVIQRVGFPLRAQAAARISGIRYLPKGTADFPIAIAKAWYTTHQAPCTTNNKITFHPTGTAEGCVGWHTFQEAPASASVLKSILSGLRHRTFVSPEIDVTDTKFIFTGGTVTSAIGEVQELYNARKNAAGELPVLIPVYDRDDCTNPNGWIRIIGVARAVITKVDMGGDKRIEARIQCDVIDLGESGGPDFGVLAAGPDLVR